MVNHAQFMIEKLPTTESRKRRLPMIDEKFVMLDSSETPLAGCPKKAVPRVLRLKRRSRRGGRPLTWCSLKRLMIGCSATTRESWSSMAETSNMNPRNKAPNRKCSCSCSSRPTDKRGVYLQLQLHLGMAKVGCHRGGQLRSMVLCQVMVTEEINIKGGASNGHQPISVF